MKHLILPLGQNLEGLGALMFALKYFNDDLLNIKILWLGKRESVDQRVFHFCKNSKIKLGGLTQEHQTQIMEVIDQSISGKGLAIETIFINKLTRKGVIFFGSYADGMIITNDLYKTYFLPLFKGKRALSFQKSACPKIIVPENYSDIKNIVMINFESQSTSLMTKQFCYLFNGKCNGLNVNMLDVSFSQQNNGGEETKSLLAYLKHFRTKPAIFKYSGENLDQLKQFLNISKNTLWVSPIESTLELNLITKGKTAIPI